jgi:hypothetical protein
MLKVTIVPEQELAQFLAQQAAGNEAEASSAEETVEQPAADAALVEADATVLEESPEEETAEQQ